MKIGLLGGSFNPAHDGHKYISELAIKRLGLDQVWWLVSPQNPLKSTDDMADFAIRLDHAEAVAGEHHPKIKISAFEMEMNTRYTSETLRLLTRRYPNYEFHWIMGGDNLVQLPKWKNWKKIFIYTDIHVFDRDEYFYEAMRGRAVANFPNKISYHRIRRMRISSTEIRNKANS